MRSGIPRDSTFFKKVKREMAKTKKTRKREGNRKNKLKNLKRLQQNNEVLKSL